MSIGNTFENDLLALIFNGTPIANIADNASVSPLTQLFVALHTADPGEAGTQSTNEVAYSSYARVGVNRNTGGWPAPSAGAISPAANIDFPLGTGGSGAATHASIGVASSGATKILFSGALSITINCGNGITPRLTTASVISLD